MRKFVARVERSDLEPGKLVRLKYPPFDVVVTNVDGEIFAIEDACNHAGAALSKGWIEENRIVCPVHGFVFCMRTGELLAPEGLCQGQRTFVVRPAEAGEAVEVFDEYEIEVKL